MCSPVQVFLLYSRRSELMTGIAGLTAFPSRQNVRNIVLNSSKLYDLQSDAVVGELSISISQIGSTVSGVINSLIQAQYNIFDQLIIPNTATGSITINGTINTPVKHVSQDWFGRKVIIQHLDNTDPDIEAFEISVYSEEL